MSLLPFTRSPGFLSDMLLERSSRDPFADPLETWPSTRSGFPSMLSTMAPQNLFMDIIETGDSFLVHADVPGAKDEDVELKIENGMLALRVTREQTRERDVGIEHRRERFFGELKRTIKLPSNADQDNATATLEGGVLSITLPKLDAAAPGKKIPLVTSK